MYASVVDDVGLHHAVAVGFKYSGEWSLRTRYMMAVVPVTSIIFLASFVPCLMATDIPVSFKDMVIVWLERMLLSVVITGIFAILLFP